MSQFCLPRWVWRSVWTKWVHKLVFLQYIRWNDKIKHAGNSNYIKAMEISGSGPCGWKSISNEMRYRPYGLLNWKTMKVTKEIPLTRNSLFSFLFTSSLVNLCKERPLSHCCLEAFVHSLRKEHISKLTKKTLKRLSKTLFYLTSAPYNKFGINEKKRRLRIKMSLNMSHTYA